MERAVQETCVEAAESGLLASAHDLSEGGLAVAAAESAFAGPGRLGCRLDLDGGLRPDALLFGEAQSRILVTVAAAGLPALLELAAKRGVPAAVVGEVGGPAIRIAQKGSVLIDVPVDAARAAWMDAIPAYFKIGEG